MSSLPTPPRLSRVPLPLPPRSPDSKVDADARLQPADIVDGRYQIEEQIGEGGVGIVYRAMQLKLHRRVAIKFLQQDLAVELEQRPRFEREAITLAALSHPNIVSVQDYGVFRGKPFLVMELLEGKTLREILDKEGALAPARAVAIIRQILHALIYAHSLGIVHRDLKPANLVLQTLPSHEHVKVLDFGMVKLMPGSYLDRGVQLSRVGFAFGTPAYMSPEHATGGPVDVRTDVYSTGVLLFELLTGKKPFDGELHDVIRHHLSTPMPKLWDKNPALVGQEALQAIIERAAAKLQNDRYPDATALLNVLEALDVSGSDADPMQARRAAVSLRPAEVVPDSVFEHAGARVDQALRVVRHRWSDRLKPELQRLFRRTRARAGELAQAARERSRDAWATLLPRLEQAAQKARNGALELQQRLLKKGQPESKLALPAKPQALGEAPTVSLDDSEMSSRVIETEPQDPTKSSPKPPRSSIKAP